LGFGLETTVSHQDEGLHLWLDRGLHPGRLGWLFPCGEHSRVGLASYTGNGVKGKQVTDFALNYGPGARSLHGGHFPLKLRSPVAGPLFLVGDAAGQCLPLTAEGIRPAIYFGQQCGALLQLVLDERLTLAQAQSTYRRLQDSYRHYYRWLLQHQSWTTRLPAAVLAAVMKLTKVTGQSERFLRRYCAMMPIAPLDDAKAAGAPVTVETGLAPAALGHALRGQGLGPEGADARR
jgi:flavin-dependent dehydrogenase